MQSLPVLILNSSSGHIRFLNSSQRISPASKYKKHKYKDEARDSDEGVGEVGGNTRDNLSRVCGILRFLT